jgi:hypothetical protein
VGHIVEGLKVGAHWLFAHSEGVPPSAAEGNDPAVLSLNGKGEEPGLRPFPGLPLLIM